MINLLPPGRKAEIRFAKINRALLSYIRLTCIVALVLGAVFSGTLFYVNIETTKATADVTAKTAELASQSSFEAQAKDASIRLTAIKQIQATKTHFSSVIADLAKTLPQGVSIDTMTLTGDDTKPVGLAVTGPTYNSLLALRDALAASSRISGADLESITHDDTGYHGTVVIGFKKGQAK